MRTAFVIGLAFAGALWVQACSPSQTTTATPSAAPAATTEAVAPAPAVRYVDREKVVVERPVVVHDNAPRGAVRCPNGSLAGPGGCARPGPARR
jgi:hypothetical protein